VVNVLLEAKNLTVHYGKSVAINDVSLEVAEGSIVSLIGANGAGKSTVLRALSGLVPLSAGEIWFLGKRIDKMTPAEIVKMGLVQVPEGRWLFPHLSVLINLQLGATIRNDKKEINEDLEKVYERFPRLWERRKQKAGTLSGGEQQMLAIGRGLMAKPKLFLLDEPSLGLAPIVVENLGDVIEDINKEGVSVLLVEQNVPLALRVAQRGYALQIGKVVLEGDIEKIKSSDIIERAYLGE
jgi:branched-chain amino acid transport system ATP-binding protein